MSTSCNVTIFEGPDGGGKTHAAKDYAFATDARYVHFPSLPRVGKNLARMYVEAMLPALLGYQDVVLDRCWLSELPYGIAFRDGEDRLTDADRRILERLAMRCGAVVVWCLPEWQTVYETYVARKSTEMLESAWQLRTVYEIYETSETQLPWLKYDYVKDHGIPFENLNTLRCQCHPIDIQSAGNWTARTILVGEGFGERKDNDSFYQWPFGSFNKAGCSQWLAEKFDEHGIHESGLLWVNADQDLSAVPMIRSKTVIALGNLAYSELLRRGMTVTKVAHPQYQKRFSTNAHYQLLDLIY